MAVREKIENIQALRGVAVLLVLLYHGMLHEKKYGLNEMLLPDFLQVGASGVDLFFVISGFVITTVTRGHFGKDGAIGMFIWNRMTRIYPLFWFYWLLFVLAFYLFPQNMATASLGSSYAVLKSFLLLPQDHFPILSVSWTLVHELYFYIVFSLFLLFDRKRLGRFLLVFLLFLAAGNIIHFFAPFAKAAWLKVVIHPLTLEFIAGCLISELIHGSRARGYALASFIGGAAGLVVLSVIFLRQLAWEVPDGWTRVALFGLPCAAIVYGAAALEIQEGRKISRLLNVIGDASYSIYLSHAMVFSVIGVLSGRLFNAGSNAVLVFLMLSGALVWGLLSYYFIERPTLSLLRKTRGYIFKQGAAASNRAS